MSSNSKVVDAGTKQVLLLQDIFIVIALSAGMNVEAVRKHLKVDKKRINAISKYIDLPRKS